LKRADGDKVRQHSEIEPKDASGKSQDENMKSGLDMVLWLSLSNDISIKRALGQKKDPLTGKVYHLDDAPPPTNEPGLQDRLVSVSDDAERKLQLHYQLNLFDTNQRDIRSLYEKFNTLKVGSM
jgi:adenylate kinase